MLVERIIQKILNDKIDIDKLLVVTFTNSAASEMRERVLEAIYKKLDEEPDNTELQKQIVLLGKSHICTIHSFCLDVIKNNFYELDLSANFRIISEEENEILKQEVLEDLFETLYEEENECFAKLVNTYTGYRGDEPLKEMVLRIYKFMQSNPFPIDWLNKKIEMFNINKDTNIIDTDNNINDFSKSIWGEILLKDLQDEIIDGINSLKIVRDKLEKFYELDKYRITIEDDIMLLKNLYDSINISWDKAFEFASIMKFKTWPSDRKIVIDLKDEAKISRDSVKNKLMKKIKNVLVYDSNNAYKDIFEMYEVLNTLKDVIIKFNEEFKKRKKERNVIDFNDIEHYALEILVTQNENGSFVPTDVAKNYQKKFEEIAIDEYQDSNYVQEYILNVISRSNNIFMVGDVKQSIYKFRQACPDLFLEKYNNYSIQGNDFGTKIKLFKNFRSKKNILDITNLIFENIMSMKLGDIDYNEEEYLNLGADFEEIENGLGISELDIIDLKEDDDLDIYKDESNMQGNNKKSNEIIEESGELYNNISNVQESNVQEEINNLKKEEIEAKFVANRIKEIINSKLQIKDKKQGYRTVTYKDIVILLRSTAKLAPVYERELIRNNIPVFSDSSTEYLESLEIQIIINLLKIIDNPIDDISLVSVMRSKIGMFTDNEILEIRLCNKEGTFYECLNNSIEEIKEENLKNKIKKFINNLNTWRNESDYLSLAELIWKIYVDTGFYSYVGLMPNGELKMANLKMLFERAKEYEKTSFKGIFNFIKYIEKIKNGNTDMQSAKIIGENENVVRIMSIHKSKGLEFPIVFLSSTSKKINMMDASSDLLLHQKIGLGPEYINYDKRIEYSTSAKDAIKVIIKNENIAEEMRILYVALTRAKEKLIITGVSNDLEKDKNDKKELLKIYEKNNGKISPILLKKYISYLDWILLVYLKCDMKKVLQLNEYKKDDILSINEMNENDIRKFDFTKKIDLKKYEKYFLWEYSDLLKTKLPLKSTVSNLKQINNSDFYDNTIDFNRFTNNKIGLNESVPEFIRNDDKSIITGSRRGTLMHLVLESIDFYKNYSLEDIEKLKQELLNNKKIMPEELKYIDAYKIENFLKSDLANTIKKCSIIEKEKAFCTKIFLNEIMNANSDETILVQGIVDLYGITNDNKIILVDYKTDFVQDESELINKYYMQLKLYKKALEEGLQREVSDVYIYSLYLNKEIKVSVKDC